MEWKWFQCRDTIAMLAHAGSMNRWQRVRFRLHLAFCRSCRAYLRSYRAVVQMARAVHARVHGDVPEELVQAILEMR